MDASACEVRYLSTHRYQAQIRSRQWIRFACDRVGPCFHLHGAWRLTEHRRGRHLDTGERESRIGGNSDLISLLAADPFDARTLKADNKPISICRDCL